MCGRKRITDVPVRFEALRAAGLVQAGNEVVHRLCSKCALEICYTCWSDSGSSNQFGAVFCVVHGAVD